MEPNFDSQLSNPDQKSIALDANSISPLTSDHDLTSALQGLSVIGLPGMVGQAAPTGMDATGLLNDLMAYDAQGAAAAQPMGVVGISQPAAHLFPTLPDNSLIGIMPTAATHPATLLPSHVAFSQQPTLQVGQQIPVPGNHIPPTIVSQPAAVSTNVAGLAGSHAQSLQQQLTTPGNPQVVIPPASSTLTTSLSSPNIAAQSPGGLSATSQYEDEEQKKREMHNFIERRRRYNINDRIKELGGLLPGTEPDTRQNKGNILKTAVSYIKRLQKIESRYRDLSRKHRQYSKTLTVFKSRLEEYDAACQQNGLVVPSASQEAALLTRVDLAKVTLDQCVTLVDCLESTGSEAGSDITSLSSMGPVSDDEGWSEDDDVRSNASAHSAGGMRPIAPRP